MLDTETLEEFTPFANIDSYLLNLLNTLPKTHSVCIQYYVYYFSTMTKEFNKYFPSKSFCIVKASWVLTQMKLGWLASGQTSIKMALFDSILYRFVA